MEFDLEEAILVLERTPKALAEQLLGLPGKWLQNNEGEKTWSPNQVLGHLVYGEETDWLPRTKHLLKHGTGKPFEPYDRYAQDRLYSTLSTSELITLFTKKRKHNIEKLKTLGLSEEDLEKKGLHPELGEITLREMLSAWVVHDLGHIAQISRTKAKNYKSEIGPWVKYLTIVRSSPAPEE